MNVHLRSPGLRYVTRAAEGLGRRCWTVAEIEAMVVVGIVDADERFELVDGEVVPMSPKGIRHEVIKASLNKWWMQRLDPGTAFVPETTFRLNETSFLEPDFVFFSSSTKLANLGPSNALLAVEIADSSLRYDTGRKAQLYATHHVAELWVIDADSLDVHIFSTPQNQYYLQRRLVTPDEVLVPHFAPEIALKMAELPLL